MRRRSLASAALAFTLAGCGGIAGDGSDTRLVAPAWVADYCTDVARLHPQMLCPREMPLDLTPSPNAAAFKPKRNGYLLEGYDGDRHWIVIARREVSSAVDQYHARNKRQVGVDTVHGEPAAIVVVDFDRGIVADHVAVEWREDGVAYAMTVHRIRGDDPFQLGQRVLVPYAEAMKPRGG
jgi:hypothetical protein